MNTQRENSNKQFQADLWSDELLDLYTNNFDSLVRIARRVLWRTDLAEEVVQEAFIRYQRLTNPPSPGKELAYLRTMVTNSARTCIRRQQTELKRYQQHSPVTIDVAENVVDAELSTSLVNHLGTLTDRQREVLVLRYAVGYSELEVAKTLGISPGSVKAHSSRGRTAMRHSLSAISSTSSTESKMNRKQSGSSRMPIAAAS